jgi:dTDP-4-dehydrorhamnose 3,5-epimerase-like enzyme
VSLAAAEVVGCRLLELHTASDSRGHLTVLEGEQHIPFAIQRVFYIYAVSDGESRAGHAHREQQQVILAPVGSFEVIVDDGVRSNCVTLARPDRALYVPPLVWIEIRRFSEDAVCLVLASTHYQEGDYHRDYAEFQRAALLRAS